jgi:hypothetical protein
MKMKMKTKPSLKLKVTLIIDGWELEVEDLGTSSLLLKQPMARQAAEGRLLVEVDGVQRVWSVLLPNGIPLGSRRLRIKAKPD